MAMKTEQELRIFVDYNQSLDQALQKAGCAAHEDVLLGRFRSKEWESGRIDLDMLLVRFDNDFITTREILKAMKAQGMRPATLRELLAMIAGHPNDIPRLTIALGSTWRTPDGTVVPKLDRSGPRSRYMEYTFRDEGSGWDREWLFAAARV